jgi:hypothetical protein
LLDFKTRIPAFLLRLVEDLEEEKQKWTRTKTEARTPLLADLPFSIEVRKELVASGRALPHHIYRVRLGQLLDQGFRRYTSSSEAVRNAVWTLEIQVCNSVSRLKPNAKDVLLDMLVHNQYKN